jgi:hypothetical protein
MLHGWSAVLRSFSIVCVIALTAASAPGALISFITPGNATGGGQPVSAEATFTTSANQVTILLENLQANPTSVVQCLSGLQFRLSTFQNAGTLGTSSGVERNIAGDGSFTDIGAAAVGWSLATAGPDLKLNLLNTPTAPDHTIIGPPDGSNLYSNANGSIVNGTHSPFIGLSASFTLNVPGVTAQSTVSSAIFQFNTSAGTTVPGITITQFPEPGTLALAGLAACGAMIRRKR